MEAQRSQYGDFTSCIVAADVVCRVCFSVALFLSFLQRRFIGHARIGHIRQNIVCRAVHDADDFFHRIAVERGVHRPHDGNPAGDAGFKLEVYVAFLSHLQQRHTIVGNEVLVGADYALAFFEALLNAVLGKIGAAHDFNDNLYFVIVDDIGKVRRKQNIVRQFHLFIFRHIPNQDALNRNFRIELFFNQRAVHGQQIDDAFSNGTAPQ